MARILDLVQHANVGTDELAWREPQGGSGDFRIGSQVVVRENQAAVFVRGGKALDVLGPGTHTITTANVPLLIDFIGKAFNNQSPFTAEVYFINLADFPQLGWGTSQPLALETPGRGLGWLLLQGHGVFDMKVADPQRFCVQYAIGKPIVRLSDVKERLLTIVLGELQDVIATHGTGDLMGLNRMINEIEQVVLVQIREKFAAVGVAVKAFEMKPLTAAPTSAEDLRNMGLLDIATYQALQAADAMRDAANNPNGMAGAGVGIGAGIGLGQMVGQIMGNQAQAQSKATETEAQANPKTKADIQALLDNLDLRLANGEISEKAYERLVEKWEARLANAD